MLPLAILTVVCVLTYVFEIVFGLAGTIMMVAILSVLFDTKTLVIYSVLPQVLVGSIGLARSPKTVDRVFLAKMLGFALIGGVAGLYLFYWFPPDVFQRLLATAITLFGIYLVAAPGRLRLHPVVARLLDTLAGASQALFGISGPIAMTRLFATFREKLVVRNYALAFFLSLNVMRAGSYIATGAFTREILTMMLVSGPFLAVSLWFANHLHFRLDEAVFRRVVSWLILIGGVSLFVR